MIVVIANEKGGTGKTTLATTLAILRAQSGKDVLLVDADPQASAAEFTKVREDEGITPGITCVSITGRAVSTEIRKLAPRYEDIIVDVGGRDSAGMRGAMIVAEVLVVPFLAGQFDLWGVESMDAILEDALALNPDMRRIAVLNKRDSNKRAGLAQEAADCFEEIKNIDLSPAQIGYRVAYRRAAAEGKAVNEMGRCDQKAVAEAIALYKEVFGDAA